MNTLKITIQTCTCYWLPQFFYVEKLCVSTTFSSVKYQDLCATTNPSKINKFCKITLSDVHLFNTTQGGMRHCSELTSLVIFLTFNLSQHKRRQKILRSRFSPSHQVRTGMIHGEHIQVRQRPHSPKPSVTFILNDIESVSVRNIFEYLNKRFYKLQFNT